MIQRQSLGRGRYLHPDDVEPIGVFFDEAVARGSADELELRQTELDRHVDPIQIQRIIEQTNKQLASEGKAPFQLKTIPQGAATSVWAAVVAPADEIGGRYCENCHVARVVSDRVTITAITEGVRGYALDPKNAEALWKTSEEMVGEKF